MGFFDKRALKKYTKEAEIVMSYEEAMKALSDDELKAKTPYFKDLLANGKTLDEPSAGSSLPCASRASTSLAARLKPMRKRR